MLSVITGKQRSGKTYYCCTLIIEYLKESNRPIYTNLPLNPDVLCSYACNGKNRHPAKYKEYMSRIHLFKNFKGKRKREEYKYFKFYNKDYVNLHKQLGGLFLDQESIKRFWYVTDPNSVIILDEIYQWFGSANSMNRDKEIQSLRIELLTYTRQHGHIKDDMFLISHSMNDLDIFIRRGVQRYYIVENAKYKNICEKFLFRGIKWPIQFFIIRAFEPPDKQPSDTYVRASIPHVFKCYESFSQPETLLKKKADKMATSTDTHIDNKKNILNYLKQSWFFLVIIIFGMIVLYVGYGALKNTLKSTVKTSNTSTNKTNRNNQKTTRNNSYKTSQKPVRRKQIIEYIKVVFISPNIIIFEDNFKLNIGDLIKGYEVKKFYKDYVLVSNAKGINYKVSYGKLRVSPSKPERS